MRLEFDWDVRKAASNKVEHGISFEEAMEVFRDPLAMSRIDDEHGGFEERWVTLGLSSSDRLIVVVHTFAELSDELAAIRIISARTATEREACQYEDG